MKILVVEDDPRVATLIEECLRRQHYTVETVADGEMALAFTGAGHYDLLILDWMLPKLDGIGVCQRLRSQGSQIPILMLTARDTSLDKVQGLDVGADDYVVKPFELQEFSARVRALLRRGQAPVLHAILSWGLLALDTMRHELTYDHQSLPLTPKEYALVELFLRHGDRILSYENIIDNLWTFDDLPSKEVVKTHLKSIRQKLKTVQAPIDLIENIYGVGYRLNPKY